MWQRELCWECEAQRCQGAETQEPATLFKEMLVGGAVGGLLPTALILPVSVAQLKAPLLPLFIKSGRDFPQRGWNLAEISHLKSQRLCFEEP